jgi:hypothetical protein
LREHGSELYARSQATARVPLIIETAEPWERKAV